ncbi:type II toxin-antitoxin system PemK/MazF family toxin [Sphingobacterium corticis]|uniref:mRNA interferase n=1 Tax=Sphingobacterium corticis TaxID=1812823 RepID=A0ABW5NFA5_9SPHI
MDLGVKRFEVYYVDLNPTVGREINKKRPCVIISPDEINDALQTTIIVPLTTTIRNYPSRITCKVKGKIAQVCLDQIRAVDQIRLLNRIAVLDPVVQTEVCDCLIEMFEL